MFIIIKTEETETEETRTSSSSHRLIPLTVTVILMRLVCSNLSTLLNTLKLDRACQENDPNSFKRKWRQHGDEKMTVKETLLMKSKYTACIMLNKHTNQYNWNYETEKLKYIFTFANVSFILNVNVCYHLSNLASSWYFICLPLPLIISLYIVSMEYLCYKIYTYFLLRWI